MIFVLDSLMGSGKTSAMINFINNSAEDEKFLFITPYLSEVNRILNACPTKNFKAPNEKGGKQNNIQKLFKKGYNVVATHALFTMFNAETISLVKDQGYTLIIDEVVNTINSQRVSSDDIQMLLNSGFIDIGENRKITWLKDDYSGNLVKNTRNVIESNDIFLYGENTLMCILSPELFTSFKDVYIMTYMFEAQLQRAYFDMQHLEYSKKYVSGDSLKTYYISDEPVYRPPVDFKSLIRIEENDKLNLIGNKETALSRNWYKNNLNKEAVQTVRKNLLNFMKNYTDASANEKMWTTFCSTDDEGIDCKKILKGAGFANSFLACNARGTNDYRDRYVLAYMINRYVNPFMKNIINQNGFEFDEDKFALAELLQWTWRSAIRDGKKIHIYLPSIRMRNLFTTWIDEVSAPTII